MKKLSLVAVLFFCFSFSQSYAQFEGKIEINSYKVDSGDEKKDDAFTLYITPERILLQGDKSYKVGGTLQTEGILVRHKEEDFVFLTGDKQAMKITKAGITSFMNMFGGDAKQEMQQSEQNVKFEKTGETQKIRGYNCEKFIFTDNEKPEKQAEVWMTKGVDINWGMLADSWNENMSGFAGGDLPLSLIFDQGYFPILWEQYDEGELESRTEAQVTSTDVARSMVQLSPDIEVVSLQEYLFEQMRKSQ